MKNTPPIDSPYWDDIIKRLIFTRFVRFWKHEEDLAQEARLVLCEMSRKEKYQNLPAGDIHKIFWIAATHKLTDYLKNWCGVKRCEPFPEFRPASLEAFFQGKEDERLEERENLPETTEQEIDLLPPKQFLKAVKRFEQKETHAKIFTLHAYGWKLPELSKIFGCSERRVSYILWRVHSKIKAA